MSAIPALFDRDPPPRLLHNMSVPPKTVVRYEGLTGLFREAGFGGSGVGSIKFRSAGVYGSPLRFRLPATFPVDSAARIWTALGHAPDADPEAALAALIESRARTLSLPNGCVVVPRSADDPAQHGDVLSALAVLTKCSGRVWLRAKTPNLTALRGRRDVTLLVPPTFLGPTQTEPTP